MRRLWLSFSVSILMFTLMGCVQSQGPASRVVDKEKAIDGFVSLGMAYLQRDNRDASRRNFEKAFEIDPRSAKAFNGMGLLYQLNGEAELAETAFKRALKSDAGYSQARMNYGAFLYQQGRYQEAFDSFYEVSEDLTYERRALSLAYLGQTALKLGNPARAQSAFEHSLNIDNGIALAKLELAELHFAKEEYAEAKSYLDQFAATEKSSSKSLWLGIRIERIFGNKDKEASYALALKNLYPYSKEYLAFKNTAQQGG